MTEPQKKLPMSERHLPRLIVRYIALISTVSAIIVALSAKDDSADLQNAAVNVCQDVRAPTQKFYQDQLAESLSHDFDYYEQRFPDYPPDELRQAIKDSRDNLTKLVAANDPGLCESSYNP